MAPITSFDTTGFPVTFAAAVKNFDPLNFTDKKEARKMGRFIHFALAATHEAMASSGLKIGPENAERIGVHIGSGIGGFDVIEREHSAMLQGGPRKISPFFIPAAIVNLAAGQVSIRYGAKGPNRSDGDGVHHQRSLRRRRLPGHRARRCRRDDCRRRGSSHYPHGRGRLCGDARAFDTQQRSGACLPPFRPRPRWLCRRGRRGHSDSRRIGARARRAAPRSWPRSSAMA